MKVKAVTFDCAQTLLHVDWRPAVVAVECAKSAGFAFDETHAAQTYDRLLRANWSRFVDANRSRDAAAADAFWADQTARWANECGFPLGSDSRLLALAEEAIFGDQSSVFKLYEDVVGTLAHLQGLGIRMAVVSNWDISLHKTLRVFGLSPYFEFGLASMEEGVEKPDPRLFEIALGRLGLGASDVLHVGDNPIDDYRGAKQAGLHALIVDRASSDAGGIYVSSLAEVPSRLDL